MEVAAFRFGAKYQPLIIYSLTKTLIALISKVDQNHYFLKQILNNHFKNSTNIYNSNTLINLMTTNFKTNSA